MFRFSARCKFWRERASIANSTGANTREDGSRNMFSSRKEAVNHLKTVVLEASGQGVQIDAKASGKSRVVFRCPAVFRLQEEVEVGAPTHEAACRPWVEEWRRCPRAQTQQRYAPGGSQQRRVRPQCAGELRPRRV